MQKRFISSCILVIYSIFLINLLLFKIKLLTIGHLRFKFSQVSGKANFVPFKTILPYLLGAHGWFIAFINLAGNIALFIPVGFLIPLIYRKMTWQKSLIFGLILTFIIETTQTVFHIGIFDIDDIILNALGVMIGYWIFVIFTKRSIQK